MNNDTKVMNYKANVSAIEIPNITSPKSGINERLIKICVNKMAKTEIMIKLTPALTTLFPSFTFIAPL